MVNIILKNRNLIKIYRYSKIIFKWLNKHLYILTIFSIFKSFRNSIYYKVIKYLTKLVIIINLIIVSELFYTFTDFSTPIDSIIEIYSQILKPYYELIKQKIKNIFRVIIDRGDDLIMKYNDVEPIENKINKVKHHRTPMIDHLVNTEPEVENNNSFNYKDLLFYTAIAFGIYYILYLPGPNIDPGDLGNYNSINQALINSKIYIKDVSLSVWNYLTSLSSGTPNIPNNISNNVNTSPIVIGPPSIRRNALVESILACDESSSLASESSTTSSPSSSSPSSSHSVTPKNNNLELPSQSQACGSDQVNSVEQIKSSPSQSYAPGLSFWKSKRLKFDQGTQTEPIINNIGIQTEPIINNSIGVETELLGNHIEQLIDQNQELTHYFKTMLPAENQFKNASAQTILRALPLSKERKMFEALSRVGAGSPQISNLLNSAQSLVKKITD